MSDVGYCLVLLFVFNGPFDTMKSASKSFHHQTVLFHLSHETIVVTDNRPLVILFSLMLHYVYDMITV